MYAESRKKAVLLLEDGTEFEGVSMGMTGTTIGEVVFTTGMTGYQETLTDPSYFGQIVTQTFPLIGNYGVNKEDIESASSYVQGYIVREWCQTPSNFRMEHTVDWFLKEQNIIGICDIDTRALTRKLREHGVMNGMITTEEIKDKEKLIEEIRAYQITNAVRSVSIQKQHVYQAEHTEYRVALIDYGYKRNIRRSLLERGCEVTILPCTATAQQIKAGGFDGIMLSNGPGDPSEDQEIIGNLKEIADLGIPVFGICLGHQLMALAQGGKTQKLKYGHRGGNQPVIDLRIDRTYVTSQNHGYEVIAESIAPEIGQVSHLNANDRSCEGVEYKNGMVYTVQFHPEACGGPADTSFLFDRFLDMMKSQKGGA